MYNKEQQEEYKRGYSEAVRYIQGNKDITADEAFKQALGDIYPDSFTAGWIEGCKNCGAKVDK